MTSSSAGARSAVPDQWACLLAAAGPGYGKTTALRRLLPPARHVWADPETVRRVADGRLPALPPASSSGPRRWLVLDDIPPLEAGVAERLLDWASTLPAGLALAVTTRTPLPVRVSRWRGRGILGVLQPADLALSCTETAAVLHDEYDLPGSDLAGAVRGVTGGWPALVQLAAEVLTRARDLDAGQDLVELGLADQEPLTALLADPASAVAQYLADEVLPALPAAAQRLVRDLAAFEPVSADLCRALGQRGAARSFGDLVAAGAVQPVGSGYRVVPVLAAVAARGQRLTRASSLAGLAAAFYEEHGPPLAAARARLDSGDPERAAQLLTEHAQQVLAAGEMAQFVSLVDRLPASVRTQALRLHWGDALRAISQVDRAVAIFDELAAECSDEDGLPPGLAWRMGRVPYLRGEPREALAAFARAGKSAADPLDDVLVLSWTASAYWMLGEAPAAAEHATAALQAAQELGHDRGLAEAHTAMALALKLSGEADEADAHYAKALGHARPAGDVVQAARILANQSHELLARARYPEALTTARAAVAMAEQAGPAGTVVVALCNEAEALNRLGRFDESAQRYTRVLAICHRIGLRRAAVALAGLGDVHRRRGWREQARVAFEQARSIARDSGELQALAPALSGLARVLATDDPGAAADAVAEAARCAVSASSTAAVQIAQGWLCLVRGDPGAGEAATAAARNARHQAAVLAEALELRAAAETDLPAVRAALAEAHHIWQTCGATIDADRVTATIASLPDASTEERLAGSLARQRQTDAGVQQQACAVPLSVPGGTQVVAVRVLGRFEVRVGNQAVGASAWQSRKARDLLRILVARRGRVVTREELSELLWPGETAGTGHRLSVLLSIVRTTLDPERAFDSDRFVIADKSGIALDPAWVRVDVEEFLDAVAYGIRLYQEGDDALSRCALTEAVKSYLGDPFDDDPYPDWTAGVREQARAAHLQAVRALARLARRAGDTSEALNWLLRLLDLDPYDEDAHRSITATLAAAGRHGEARRAAQRYRDAMAEIGVVPDPRFRDRGLPGAF